MTTIYLSRFFFPYKDKLKSPWDLMEVLKRKFTAAKFPPNLAVEEAQTETTNYVFLSWIEEELEEGKGSYVGFRMRRNGGSEIAACRKLLYPTYRLWAEKKGDMRPLGHNKFSNELIRNLKSLGFKGVKKFRRNKGMFISGVTIKGHAH